MAPATDAEQRVASGCTSYHSAKMTPCHQAEFESRQEMASLDIASQYMEYGTTSTYLSEDFSVEEDCINVDDSRVPHCSMRLFGKEKLKQPIQQPMLAWQKTL